MAVSPRELHRVVPTVIIYNDECQFLLIKRSPDLKVFPGKWHCPGGGLSMDDYEHLPSHSNEQKQWYGVVEEALRREAREEAGVEIEKPEYLCDVAFLRPDGIPVVVLSYFAKFSGGEFKPSEEAVECAWVTAEEAQKYDLIDGIGEEILEVDRRLKSRA
jgi:8-oxo-dGTP pyrophosphatase MutT (NUDIX family)